MNIWLSKARDTFFAPGIFKRGAQAPGFVRVFLFAASVPLLLRLNLRTLQRVLEPRHIPPEPTPARIQEIASKIDTVLTLGKPLIRPGCLTRGVTSYYFLKRAGADVTLCFGMGNVNAEWVGHCWLTSHGEPILEATDPRKQFVLTYSIPQPGPAAALTPDGQ